MSDIAFSWQVAKAAQDSANPIRRRASGPRTLDITENLTVNGDLTRGLWHNSYPGLKLAGALAFPLIFVPVAFMGVPSLQSLADDEDQKKKENEELSILANRYARMASQLHTQCHREGTIWVWPYVDAQTRDVEWEFIPDESVVSILKDVRTGRPMTIIVNESLTVMTSETTQATIQRRRTFTRETVREEYADGAPKGFARSTLYRNPTGILPVNFANNADASETRGHSDYERLLADFKDYHDVSYAWSSAIAKFSTKLVQTVKDVSAWLVNNGVMEEGGAVSTALAEFDVAQADIFLNQEGEATEFQFPEGANEAFEKKLAISYYKIVQGSGVPEMVLGLVTTGNHASAEQQMSALVKYVEEKQFQKTEQYHILYSATLQLSRAVALSAETGKGFEVTWSKMDGLDATTKATVFARIAQGFGVLMQNVAITKEQLHSMWRMVYPSITESDLETYVSQLMSMARFKAYASSDYESLVVKDEPTIPGSDPLEDGAEDIDEDAEADKKLLDEK